MRRVYSHVVENGLRGGWPQSCSARVRSYSDTTHTVVQRGRYRYFVGYRRRRGWPCVGDVAAGDAGC